jgi:hypothetical protein
MNPQAASPQNSLLELNDQQQASQTCLLEWLLMNQGASFPSNVLGGQLINA